MLDADLGRFTCFLELPSAPTCGRIVWPPKGDDGMCFCAPGEDFNAVLFVYGAFGANSHVPRWTSVGPCLNGALQGSGDMLSRQQSQSRVIRLLAKRASS